MYLDEWRATRAGLPARDRGALWWANIRGRAVSRPELAELAVLRGEAVSALYRAKPRWTRWLPAAVDLLWLGSGALSLLNGDLVSGVLGLIAGPVFLSVPLLTRDDLRRAERSVTANRELLGQQPRSG